MTSPNAEVANDFFHDCLDFLHRYRLTGDAFYAIKSKRLKLFLDLRMAVECVLKAVIAYHLAPETSRDSVIRRVESFSHKIFELADNAKTHIEPEIHGRLAPFIKPLDSLPVGLRYRLDGGDFRELNEEFYYATVGSDEWLGRLYCAVNLVADSLNVKLQNDSRIISVDELLEELPKPVHNKYAKKGKP